MGVPLYVSRLLLARVTRNSLVPFLYQTQTLVAPLHCAPYSSLEHDDASQEPQGHDQRDNDGTKERQNENEDAPKAPTPRKSYLQRRAASSLHQASMRRFSKPHTMTSSEKRVFGDLLEQLGVDEKDSKELVEPKQPGLSRMNDEDRNDMAQISAIFDSVLQDMRKRQKRPESMIQETETPTVTAAKDDLRLREKLRSLAYTNEDLTELLDMGKISPPQAIDLVVRREGAKIEASLRAALSEGKGEIGIWDICRERIFSMIQHLGDDEKQAASKLGEIQPSRPSNSSTKDPTQESKTATTSFSSKNSPLEVPTCVPLEAVVTALYPKMLLVAFRLLNLHFPDSTLIAQFRSTISSLGRKSAVLGSSTALYNELIYFYWRGCHDIPGVVSLLHEMEVTGIEPDRQTCSILNAIVRQRERELKFHWERMNKKQHRRASREPWWDLPPNRKAVRDLLGPDGWIERLEERIKERKARESLYT